VAASISAASSGRSLSLVAGLGEVVVDSFILLFDLLCPRSRDDCFHVREPNPVATSEEDGSTKGLPRRRPPASRAVSPERLEPGLGTFPRHSDVVRADSPRTAEIVAAEALILSIQGDLPTARHLEDDRRKCLSASRERAGALGRVRDQ